MNRRSFLLHAAACVAALPALAHAATDPAWEMAFARAKDLRIVKTREDFEAIANAARCLSRVTNESPSQACERLVEAMRPSGKTLDDLGRRITYSEIRQERAS